MTPDYAFEPPGWVQLSRAAGALRKVCARGVLLSLARCGSTRALGFMTEISETPVHRATPWPQVAASLVCTAAALYFFCIYSALRLDVLFHRYDELNDDLKASIFQILSMLQAYRVLGVLAMVFAIWAVLHKPRWPGFLCLVPATGALFASLITIK